MQLTMQIHQGVGFAKNDDEIFKNSKPLIYQNNDEQKILSAK